MDPPLPPRSACETVLGSSRSDVRGQRQGQCPEKQAEDAKRLVEEEAGGVANERICSVAT